MTRDAVRQIANVVGLIVVLALNGAANALPINGMTTGEISDSFDVFFVPAGYVFGIWGVIYTFLIIFVVYQALPQQRENLTLRRIGYWFVASCAANSAWILAWHYLMFPLTLVLMIGLLISLMVIYWRAGIGRETVSTATHWAVHVPFSIYLGWISVATIANVTTTLTDLGWSGFGIDGAVWAAIMLAIGTALTIIMIVRFRDVAYTAVIVWAFIGIVVSQADTTLVAGFAGAGAALVAIWLVVALINDFRRDRRDVPPLRTAAT